MNIYQFFKAHISLLSISFVALWLLFPVDGLVDMYLIQPWLSSSGEFYLKHNFYLEVLNHQYVKYILIAVYISLLTTFIGSFKIDQLKDQRVESLYFFVMVIISTSVIGIMKTQSAHACPWDMILQQQDSYSWIMSQKEGHCFPGGHASTGFALMTGYFIHYFQNRRRAIFYLFASLILGFGMGWAQMMRGAHFFSHNLWTGWIIWLINLTAFWLFHKKLKVVDSDN